MGEITKVVCVKCRRVIRVQPKRDAYKTIETLCDTCRAVTRSDYVREPERKKKK